MDTLQPVFLIFASVLHCAVSHQWVNCSTILCPTRENECLPLDQISNCDENSLVLPDVSDTPIIMQFDEHSGLFVLNALEVNGISFTDAALLWSKLGNVNIFFLSISNFCDAYNFSRRWVDAGFKTPCKAMDPRYQTIDINHFAVINSVQRLHLSFNCAHNFTGNVNEKFPNVVHIKLDNNFLADIPPIVKTAKTCRTLSLGTNIIDTLKSNDFEHNTLLRELDLGANCLHNLPPGVFSHLPELEILDLGHNNLETLPEELLSYTTNLIQFSISYNILKEIPAKIFQKTPKIKELFLDNNKITFLPEELLLNANQLELLSLNDNQLFSLPPHAFRSTANLKELRLFRNNFTEIPSIKFGVFAMGGPASIDLSSNNINIVDGSIINRIPQALKLVLSDNCLKFSPNNATPTVLPIGGAIKLFECENCCIDEIVPQLFLGVQAGLLLRENNITKLDMTDLKHLSLFDNVDLSDNEIKNINVTFEFPLIRNITDRYVITTINLAGNPVECDCMLLNFMMFVKNKTDDNAGRTDLMLDASNLQCNGPGNLIGQQVLSLNFDQFVTEYFPDCPENCSCQLLCFNRAIHVNCTDAGLHQFPPQYPSIFHNLTLNFVNNQIDILPPKNDSVWQRVTMLNLRNNKLTSLTNFTSTPALIYLNIEGNELTKFEQELIKFITANNVTKVLELSNNPWTCNCDLKYKYDTIMNTKNVIVMDEKQLKCTSNGIVYKFTEFDKFCPSDSILLTILLGCLVVTIGVISVFSILFLRYKHLIKYFLFSKGMCLWWVSEDAIDADKEFDAFVSYSSLDGEWVGLVLINGLENEEPRYKICVHERDWIGGSLIVEQIARSVESSRRTILVLTDNFLTSEWSRVEFALAYQQALQDKISRVIVVVPNELPNLENCDPEFRSYIKLTSYIEANKPHFWRKLRCSMPRRRNVPGNDYEMQ